MLVVDVFYLGFASCKAEKPLQSIELQEKGENFKY